MGQVEHRFDKQSFVSVLFETGYFIPRESVMILSYSASFTVFLSKKVKLLAFSNKC
jgi:hypothetical protein